MAGGAPVRDERALPGVASTLRWMIAFLDCSGISLTAVDEPQPASGMMMTQGAMPRETTNLARARVLLCHMVCFSGCGVFRWPWRRATAVAQHCRDLLITRE